MKAEFELNIDGDGDPVISFRHFDRNGSLDQRLLKIFINKSQGKIILVNTSGYLEAGIA